MKDIKINRIQYPTLDLNSKLAGNEPIEFSHSEIWRLQYRQDRYMKNLDKNQINQRFKDVFNNNQLLYLDIGFRVLKVDSSNMEDVYYHPSEVTQLNLCSMVDNIKKDRTPEDLLFQVMLDLGILLSAKIEEKMIGGKKVFNVGDGYLLACFDSDVTDETVQEIAKCRPYYAVFRDSSLANDNVAANFEQIFAAYSPSTVRKVL